MTTTVPNVEQINEKRSCFQCLIIIPRFVRSILIAITIVYLLFSIYYPIWILLQSDENIEKVMSKVSASPRRISTTWDQYQYGFTIDPVFDGNKSSYSNCLFHTGATVCYRRKSRSTPVGAQCCYDKNGHWIIRWRHGAGTVDFYYPKTSKHVSRYQHFFSDVLYYLPCCFGLTQMFNTCQQYMKYRPVGHCYDSDFEISDVTENACSYHS